MDSKICRPLTAAHFYQFFSKKTSHMIPYATLCLAFSRSSGRFWRRGGLALLLCLSVGVGCDSSKKSPPAEPPAEHVAPDGADGSAGAEQVDTGPTALLAEAGPVRVTMQDFEHSRYMARLVNPMDALEIPDAQVASTQLQILVTRSLLNDHIIRHLAAERGLTVTDEERRQALESRAQIAHFAPLFSSGSPDAAAPAADELKARGLTMADLADAADGIAYERKLQEALLEAISDEDLWRDYAWRNDRAGALLVYTTNTPTMEELLAYLDKHPDEVASYFDKNKQRWQRADAPVEFDDAMRRHIAAILVADKAPVPSVQVRVDRAIAKMQKIAPEISAKNKKIERMKAVNQLVQEFKDEGLSAVRTDLFPRDPRGFVPDIGIVEDLTQQLFEVDLSDPVSARPIFARDKVWAFMLLEREHLSRENFEREKSEFRQGFIERVKDTLVEQYVEGFARKHDAKFDLRPLRQKYGEDPQRAKRAEKGAPDEKAAAEPSAE